MTAKFIISPRPADPTGPLFSSPPVRESAIARTASGTQYIRKTGKPAGRGRLKRQSMPAVEHSSRQGRRCVNSPVGFSPGHADRYTMKDEKDKGEGQSGKPAKDPRQERLKQALRANLKRRKSQARGRDDFTTAFSNSDDVAPHDGREKKPGK
jgi:hypothetical protein